MSDIEKSKHFILHNNIWKALLVMALGLAVTIISTIYTSNTYEYAAKQEYLSECKEIKINVAHHLSAQEQFLKTGSSLFLVSDTVTRKMWKEFNEGIGVSDYLHGIKGIGFVAKIPGSDLAQHTRSIRNEGFPDYAVRPSGSRSVYTSIIYMEPFSGQILNAFGYDMFSEPVRRRAMELSCDSSMAVFSGQVIPSNEIKEDLQLGTMMIYPVYRNGMPVKTVEQRRSAIKGWVYCLYRMDDLMQGLQSRLDSNGQDRIHLQVYDDSLAENTMNYNSQKGEKAHEEDLPERRVSMQIIISGRKLILLFTQSMDQFVYINTMALIVLGGGIAISLLMLVLSLAIFRNQEQSRQISSQLKLDLLESGERFSILLDSTAEGIFGINLEGNCIFANKAFMQLFGFKNIEEIEGRNMHDLIHHSHSDGSMYCVEDCKLQKSFLRREGTHADDEVLWRADGTSFPAEYWSHPVLINEEVEGFVVTFVDITERKKSEAITKAAIIEAQNANMAKSEFLSRMSHELRTPLNAILGFAQLMQMGDLNPHHQKGVQYILKSGKHLLKLINEVLDITRIESGNLSMFSENIQLREFAEEIVGMAQPLAYERKIKLENVMLSEDQLFVYTDPGKLKQIWMNLLNNAIKYNKPGGTVRIVTECRHDLVSGTNLIRTSFIDTGYGITPENIKKLFIPFERVGAEKYNVEGTGLRLSVVRTLVDAMGLKMGLESVPDEGSIFWIEMPLSEDPCHTGVKFAGAGREGLPDIRIKGTILYVEDNLANVELVGEIISNHRPEIRLVETNCGDKAVELAIEYSPDIVLVVIDLNDINGIQAFENLQSEAQTKNIPVVVVASDAVVPRAEEMMDAGAQSYLTKPLDVISFLKIVDQWI